MAFCSSDGISLERARSEVAKVLKAKGVAEPRAPYLGMLDYDEMDEAVADSLHLFEKHDPVWLFILPNAAATR